MRNAVIAALGVLPAFFLVFNVVFSDGGGSAEISLAIILIGAVYLLFGGLAGFWTGSWRSGLWLGAPALLIIALYSVRENHRLLLHAVVVTAALGPACLGAYAGGRLKVRRNSSV